MVPVVRAGEHGPMATHTPAPRRVDTPPGAALMTAASLDELRLELERLRHRSRSTDDGAALEERMVLQARLAALEDTIERAVVVDDSDAAPDVAVIGSTVTIEDVESGLRTQYHLGSAHGALGPDIISAASPMGEALIGARRGMVVTVDLPNGRSRTVRVASVKTPPPATGAA
jgi:transcription elongation GreA/GreB family factor